MKIADDGKILFVFQTGVVIRLDSMGYPDRSFGLLGLVQLFSPTAATIRLNSIVTFPDGRFLLSGNLGSSGSGNARLARRTSRGKPDVTFGNGGYVIGAVGTGTSDVVLSSEGGSFVCGSPTLSAYDGAGMLLGNSAEAGANSLAIQPDGKIVTIGTAFLPGPSVYVFALSRHIVTQTAR